MAANASLHCALYTEGIVEPDTGIFVSEDIGSFVAGAHDEAQAFVRSTLDRVKSSKTPEERDDIYTDLTFFDGRTLVFEVVDETEFPMSRRYTAIFTLVSGNP